MITTARYGWVRDLPDHRDRRYSPTTAATAALPITTDLRGTLSPVVDQGELASCSANAVAALLPPADADRSPSRLFIYFNQRQLQGNARSDCGGQLRDAIKAITREGACSEAEWPYDPSRVATKPVAACYRGASRDLVDHYLRLDPTLLHMRSCLAEGHPFAFGLSVFESLESDVVKRDGMVPLPSAVDSLLGGHAVVAVGYDDRHQYVIFRNSWGVGWGDKGHGYLPYAYILDPGLCADFWTIRCEAPSHPLHAARHGGSPSQRVEE